MSQDHRAGGWAGWVVNAGLPDSKALCAVPSLPPYPASCPQLGPYTQWLLGKVGGNQIALQKEALRPELSDVTADSLCHQGSCLV